jgi:Zn-dependent protease
MEFARAPKQEAPVVLEGPSSYEYTVTLGQQRRAKGRIYFSLKELKHLAIAALLVVGIGLSAGLYSDVFAQVDLTIALAVFTVILTASFFMHEIAHKVTAQRQGLWAEFRLTLWGAVLTLISLILPFKIISPGAVMVSGSARNDEIGKISLAGPATNIVLSTVLLGVAFVPSPFSGMFLFGALFNAAWIALFNLIPMGILDGYKIFSWDKKVWALTFAASVALTVISYIFIQ